MHLQFLWWEIIDIYPFKGVLCGCLRHPKPPETVLILGCINESPVTCYVWNPMFPTQVGEKGKNRQRHRFFGFLLFKNCQNLFVSFPSVDPAGRIGGNFRNGPYRRRPNPRGHWPLASISEKLLFWESRLCDVAGLSADLRHEVSQLASSLIYYHFSGPNTGKVHPARPVLMIFFCTSAPPLCHILTCFRIFC